MVFGDFAAATWIRESGVTEELGIIAESQSYTFRPTFFVFFWAVYVDCGREFFKLSVDISSRKKGHHEAWYTKTN